MRPPSKEYVLNNVVRIIWKRFYRQMRIENRIACQEEERELLNGDQNSPSQQSLDKFLSSI